MSRERPRRYRRMEVADNRVVYSRLDLMAEVDGWCMVRHPGAIPFAVTRKAWDEMPEQDPSATPRTGRAT